MELITVLAAGYDAFKAHTGFSPDFLKYTRDLKFAVWAGLAPLRRG